MPNSTGFVAYPFQPTSVREVLATAVKVINQQYGLSLKAWEDLAIGGRVIIGEICAAIDAADLFVADLTGFNLNVLYETGYAVGRGKPVWLLYDDTLKNYKWSDFRLLSSVGYCSSSSSDKVLKAFGREQPHVNSKALLASLGGSLTQSSITDSILYLKAFHETNASTRITRRIDASAIPKQVDDPREVLNQPVAWYVERAQSCGAILCHLDSPERTNTTLRNATAAFVSGLAHGFGKDVVLLAEGDYVAPLDYRERLVQYSSAAIAFDAVDSWLTPLEEVWLLRQEQKKNAHTTSILHAELSGLQLGEYIAENEEAGLVESYFVETSAYLEALNGKKQNLLFVGRKGAGKSANYLKLARSLRADHRNVVCEIKPPPYELTALLTLLSRFAGRDQKQFVVEGLWRFLLYTEIIDGLVRRLSSRPIQAWEEADHQLSDLHRESQELFEGDFALRLEQVIVRLQGMVVQGDESIAEFRRRLADKLYGELIGRVRSAIVKAVPKGARIRVLIDNLDKAWEQNADLSGLAEFLVGLLTATSKLAKEIRGESGDHEAALSLVAFLRADIFERIRNVAREPDKIQHERLEWHDPELLMRLVDERYASFHGEPVVAGAIWKHFCSSVRGVTTSDFIMETVLPRPRDLLFFLKMAMSLAVDRRHARVEERDVEDAAKKYSEFAFDCLRIEDLSYEEPIVSALIELAGRPSVIAESDLVGALRQGGAPMSDPVAVLGRLCLLSFLCIEVGPGKYVVADDQMDLRKKLVIARDLAARNGGQIRYQVHPAFRPFLEMQ